MTERPAVQVSTDDRRRWSSRSPIDIRDGHRGDPEGGSRCRVSLAGAWRHAGLMWDDGGASRDADSVGDRWCVRQVRDEDGGIRSRIEGPGGQRYAPHAVNGLRVTDVRRLRDALRAQLPAPESRDRQARLDEVLSDAVTHPRGLEEL